MKHPGDWDERKGTGAREGEGRYTSWIDRVIHRESNRSPEESSTKGSRRSSTTALVVGQSAARQTIDSAPASEGVALLRGQSLKYSLNYGHLRRLEQLQQQKTLVFQGAKKHSNGTRVTNLFRSCQHQHHQRRTLTLGVGSNTSHKLFPPMPTPTPPKENANARGGVQHESQIISSHANPNPTKGEC